MPWTGSTFIRDNSVTTGPAVWNTQATTTEFVDAPTHDYHDQDIAGGITACINKNGANSPTTNISWGGFKITNYGTASANTDVAAWGQTVGGASLDPGTFVLTITDKTAVTMTTVDLGPLAQASGGAPIGSQYLTLALDGTLTNERVLTGTAGRVTITDGGAGGNAVIDLATTGATAGVYENARVTCDVYGRITSIATGAFGTITAVLGVAPIRVQNVGSGQRQITIDEAQETVRGSVFMAEFVDPGTATAAQIATALIAAGIMAPS